LQSENDVERVITGLQTTATTGTQMNLREVGQMIADLQPRVFVMHNVHDTSGPVMVHTRWAMSYLRGPLTRQQVQVLMADQKAQLLARVGAALYTPPPVPTQPTNVHPGFAAQIAAAQAQQVMPAAPVPPPGLPEAPPNLPELPGAPTWGSPMPVGTAPLSATQALGQTSRMTASAPPGFSPHPPPVPGSTAQYYLPVVVAGDQALAQYERRMNVMTGSRGAVTLAYKPYLLAQATVRFQDRKTATSAARVYSYLIPDVDRSGLVRWNESEIRTIDTRSLSGEPQGAAIFGDLPPGLTDAKRLTALKRELADMLYTSARLSVPYNATLDLYGSPDGDGSEFGIRLQQAARERRDAEMDALTAKYETVIDRLDEQARRKAQRLESERRELANLRREQLFTTGEAVLGLLRGRTSYTLSRMSRSAVFKERSKGDVDLYQLDLQQLEDEREKAVAAYEAAVREINERWARVATTVEAVQVTPYKKDITVDVFGIGWIPFWYVVLNGQPLLLSAAE
jgi:hypothetical protein